MMSEGWIRDGNRPWVRLHGQVRMFDSGFYEFGVGLNLYRFSVGAKLRCFLRFISFINTFYIFNIVLADEAKEKKKKNPQNCEC